MPHLALLCAFKNGNMPCSIKVKIPWNLILILAEFDYVESLLWALLEKNNKTKNKRILFWKNRRVHGILAFDMGYFDLLILKFDGL